MPRSYSQKKNRPWENFRTSSVARRHFGMSSVLGAVNSACFLHGVWMQ